jgi:hypothetical protein
LPFHFDDTTIAHGLNFTLMTDLGDIDCLGEIVGAGRYEDIEPNSIMLELFGLHCRCIDLDTLIVAKRAAGRPKDLLVLAELEAIRSGLSTGADD